MFIQKTYGNTTFYMKKVTSNVLYSGRIRVTYREEDMGRWFFGESEGNSTDYFWSNLMGSYRTYNGVDIIKFNVIRIIYADSAFVDCGNRDANLDTTSRESNLYNMEK